MIAYKSQTSSLKDEGEFNEIASAIQNRRKNLGVSLNNPLELTINIYPDKLQFSMLFLEPDNVEVLGIDVMDVGFPGASFQRVTNNLEHLHKRINTKKCKTYCTMSKQFAEVV